MHKVSTKFHIENDLRIERVIYNYDGRGRHMVECKEGYRFEGERTIEIGSIKEICYSINNNLEVYPA